MYPERFPKSLSELCLPPPEVSETPPSGLSDSLPVNDFPDSLGAPPGAFNIKSKVDTLHRPRRLYLSRNGRNTILRAGSCFDNTDFTERLLLTGTLPGRLKEAHQALAEFSTYASKTLTNWLTRRSPKCKWMYTWEFQKRGALHIHLVVELPHSVSAYVKEHFQDEWNRILAAISEKTGINLYKRTHKYVHSKKVTQADVTVCDREPSRYISKYISKKATNGFGAWRYPPKTWYQVSRSLLRTLKDRTQVFFAEGLSYSQARGFIETASHNISSAVKGGARFFEGAILSWSGYGYTDYFDIKEWGTQMNNSAKFLMSVKAMHAMSVNAYNANINARCYLRVQNKEMGVRKYPSSFEGEQLMLEEIKKIMQAIITTFEYTARKGFMADYLKSAVLWYESKFDECPLNEFAVEEIFNYCEENLTP